MQRNPASGIRRDSLRTPTNHDHKPGSEPADRGLTAVRRVAHVQWNARTSTRAACLMRASCRHRVGRLCCNWNEVHCHPGDQNGQRACRINLSIDESQIRASESIKFVIRSVLHRWTGRLTAIVRAAIVRIHVMMNVPMIMLCHNVKMWSRCVIDQICSRHSEMHMHGAKHLTGKHQWN